MCQPSKPGEADCSEQGHLQPPSPTLCPHSQGPASAAQPCGSCTTPLGLFLGVLKTRASWHDCGPAPLTPLRFWRLFPLQALHITTKNGQGNAPTADCCDTSCAGSLLWEQRDSKSRFPEMGPMCARGHLLLCFHPSRKETSQASENLRQQWNMVLTNNIHDSQFSLRKYKISSIKSVITRVIEW